MQDATGPSKRSHIPTRSFKIVLVAGPGSRKGRVIHDPRTQASRRALGFGSLREKNKSTILL